MAKGESREYDFRQFLDRDPGANSLSLQPVSGGPGITSEAESGEGGYTVPGNEYGDQKDSGADADSAPPEQAEIDPPAEIVADRPKMRTPTELAHHITELIRHQDDGDELLAVDDAAAERSLRDLVSGVINGVADGDTEAVADQRPEAGVLPHVGPDVIASMGASELTDAAIREQYERLSREQPELTEQITLLALGLAVDNHGVDNMLQVYVLVYRMLERQAEVNRLRDTFGLQPPEPPAPGEH